METKEAVRLIILSLGFILIFLSFLPLIKSDKWFIRIFDYPRSQKFWINLLLIMGFLAFMQIQGTVDQLYVLVGIINQVYLFFLILPYTRLSKIQMKKNAGSSGERLKLFVANVFQGNKDIAKFLSLIEKEEPDMILLVETDYWWEKKTRSLSENYPYEISIPLENTYGMMFFSKVKIADYEIRYLSDEDIPSIKADLISSGGQRFRLYGLHPKPPVPNEALESTERDAEILKVGKEAKLCSLPVIVAGDLNDVAWSYTTRLFLKVSELLDPRIGRGFYSTFHAKSRFMRWPLDHIFCSSHFYLINLRRMPDIGSDHFPMLLEVAMMPAEIKANDMNEKQATKADLHAAEAKIAKVSTTE
jgi:endonuclease/exonuclease/phosphatase (EEP) superfamily protein YafD